jgi:hypothetical protein
VHGVTSPNAKGSGFATSEAPQETINPADFIRMHAQRKAKVLAELAMRGHTVQQGPNADFNVSRWGLCKYCTDLAALEEFAYRVGASR